MVKIQGLNSLKRKLDIIASQETIEKGLNLTSKRMLQVARDNCPVDTGKLLESITVENKGNMLELTADTDYAKFVEFGTLHQQAQPFMYPAYLEGKRYAIQDILKAMSEV